MFDSSLQFSAKLFLVFFNKSLQQQQQQAYPQRPYLFVYFLNRTVAFFFCRLQLIFCKLQSCHQFSNINLLYELFCCQLLEAPSQSLQEDYLCNLEKLHGMAHNFLLLCITWNRCCYLSGFDAAIIPVIWQQPNPRKALARPINDPEPRFQTNNQSNVSSPDFKGIKESGHDL